MNKKYRIREGFTFVQSDGSVLAGGDVMELSDDLVEGHRHKLELVNDKPALGDEKRGAPDDKPFSTGGSTV